MPQALNTLLLATRVIQELEPTPALDLVSLELLPHIQAPGPVSGRPMYIQALDLV
jgi:hypothetical protein